MVGKISKGSAEAHLMRFPRGGYNQKTASFFDCNLGKVRFCQIFDLFCQFGSKITGFF